MTNKIVWEEGKLQTDKKRENSKVGDKKRENSKKLPGQGEGKLRSVGKLQADKKRENS